MSTNPIVERFRAGEVPEQVKGAAARGALPLPAEDLLQVLFHLRGEKALQADIVKTIGEMPSEPLLDLAASGQASPEMLDFLARAAFKRGDVVEKLVLNPAVTDATLALVAQHAGPEMLELLMLNQVRLTKNPKLIQAILDNPKVTLTIRRRLKEVWDLHQGEEAKRKVREARRAEEAQAEEAARAAQEAEEAAARKAEEEAQAAADAARKAEEEAQAAQAEASNEDLAALVESVGGLEGLDDLADLEELGQSQLDAAVLEELQAEGKEEDLRLAERLLRMSVAEKVQLALKGDRGARSLLIRESSKLIQEAVIKSPKITENEIETFSTMRSLTQDVLRQIAQNREYTRNYTIAHNLVKNPRCPQPQALQLMSNLQARDLKFLLKDKSVSEAVRRQAKILLAKRQQR